MEGEHERSRILAADEAREFGQLGHRCYPITTIFIRNISSWWRGTATWL
jgi:hypothetical protein